MIIINGLPLPRKNKKDGIKLCIYDQSGSPAAHYYYLRRGETTMR